MRIRPLYFCVAAGLLLVIIVIGFRRGDDHGNAPAAAPVRPERAVPESSSSISADAVATAPSRSREAPAPGPAAVAANASVYDEVSIPTELPDTPSFNKELSRDGAVRDYRVVYTYLLGLMEFYQSCMKGRIATGVIHFFIKWDVDENHLATSPSFDRTDVPSEGDVTPEDELAFAECVKEYLATHNSIRLPESGPNGEAWGVTATFPLRESRLLKMIAEANAEPGSPGSAFRPATPRE